MSKYEQIRMRYSQGFVTDVQLERYFELGVITEEEYREIYSMRHA